MLSVKTLEHIRRRLAQHGPRWAALGCGAAALSLALGFIGDSMKVVEISDTHGSAGLIITCAADLGDQLDQAGIAALGAQDEFRITETDGRDRVHVLRAFTVPVTADGETTDLVATDETVAELLDEAGIDLDEQDIVEPALEEELERGDSITVQRVDYVDYSQEEIVPIETVYQESSLYYRDTDAQVMLDEGSEGLDLVSYRETWVDGELTAVEETGRETITPMQTALVKVYGEEAPVSIFTGPEVVDGVPVEGVTEVYVSQRSTGYSASLTAKGASGQRLTYGTVAVNPNVIPYGTLLYITSDDGRFVYGYAYAADTGTAMMTGHAFIDLYYETYSESVSNAVIPVTVYVIDDEVAAAYEAENDARREADLAAHHGDND